MGEKKACPHCGGILHKHRSEPDHRRFFGLINAAFANWRHDHDFQPDTAEHLRAWLLCKAGYREVVTIPIEGNHPAVARLATIATEAALKASKSYAFIRPSGMGLAVFRPRSIAWDRLSQKEFNPIRQAVEDVITAEIGVEADTLLRQHERAA